MAATRTRILAIFFVCPGRRAWAVDMHNQPQYRVLLLSARLQTRKIMTIEMQVLPPGDLPLWELGKCRPYCGLYRGL